jgi:hypothetical protein
VFQRLIAAAGGVTITELTGGKPNRKLSRLSGGDRPDAADLDGRSVGCADALLRRSVAGARMGERRGIRVKTSDDRYFEYDQIGIQATERVDIVVHDVGDATTAGPIVALIGE